MPLRLFGREVDDDRPQPACNVPNVRARFAAVRGVVFGMDDVLYDASLVRRNLLQLLQQSGLRASHDSFFEIWRRDYLDAVCEGRSDFIAAFTAFLRDAGLAANRIDEIIAAEKSLTRRMHGELRPFPAAATVLKRLRAAGLQLAVLEDSIHAGTVLVERLRRLGLADHFSVVVSSLDLGRTMPNPLGYRTVVERLGLRPERTAFVGRDAVALRGARRCGLRTAAFNGKRIAEADCRLDRFDDLSSLLTVQTDDLPNRWEAA